MRYYRVGLVSALVRYFHEVYYQLVAFGVFVLHDVLEKLLEGLSAFFDQLWCCFWVDPEFPKGLLREFNEIFFELESAK